MNVAVCAHQVSGVDPKAKDIRGAIYSNPVGYTALGQKEARHVLGNKGVVTGNDEFDEAIVEAVATSLFKEGYDHRWIGSPSALAFFRDSSPHYYRKKRRFAPVLEWTHLIETADDMVNSKEFKHLDAEFIASAMLNHDEGEFFRDIKRADMVPHRIVKQRYRGSAGHAPYHVRFTDIATDSPKLHKRNRIQAQLHKAKEELLITGDRTNGFHEYHGFYALFRKIDKSRQYVREWWGILNGIVAFDTPEQVGAFLEKMETKFDMVRKLPFIARHHKTEVTQIELAIKKLIRRQYPSPASKSFLQLIFSNNVSSTKPATLTSPSNTFRPVWMPNVTGILNHFRI